MRIPDAKAKIEEQILNQSAIHRLDLLGSAISVPAIFMLFLALGGDFYPSILARIIDLFCGIFSLSLCWESHRQELRCCP